MSPKKAICFARRSPIRRGSDQDVPPSRARPRLMKTSQKRARSLAIARSQASTRPRATPMATPSTTASVGFASRCKRLMRSPTMRISWSTAWGGPPVRPLGLDDCERPPPRSAPAEKFPPAPRSTSARSSGFVATSRRTCSRSAQIGALIAFFFSGRLKVRVTRPSLRSTSVSAIEVLSENSRETLKKRTAERFRTDSHRALRAAGSIVGPRRSCA